ncbi:MAG: DNA polymerase IV, partial [Clostridia bacterium]|nr:DNA polymerase IV [Clostridia bacterium]
ETVGARLRTDGVKISVISVHITTYQFQYSNKQMQLMSATDVTEEIYRATCLVFEHLWDKKTPIRQIGVHTSKVQEDAGRQYNLFDMQRYDRLEVLNRTIDGIRERFGEDSIMRVGFLDSNVSHMSGGLDKERRTGITVGIDVEREKTRVV